LSSNYIFAQNDVFNSETVNKNGIIYYKNKPLIGTLYSDTDGIPNKCDCTLKAQYHNGLLNGSKKEWYKNGKLKYSGNYKNGKKVGVHVYYYESGKKKSELKYSNGNLISKKLYYNNGNLRKEEKYSNNTIVSSILYNKDGSRKTTNKEESTPNKNNKNKKNNVSKQLVSNKTEKVKQRDNNNITHDYFVTNKDGLKKIFYPDGTIKRIVFVKDGLLVKDSLFFPNSKMQLIKKYNDGELIHLEKYNEKGQLLIEKNFENNKKHGFQKEYYENGTPKVIENYENGMLIHKEEFYKNSNIKLEENYKFNKKHGIQKYYSENGELKELMEYKNDILVNHEKYLDEGKEIISIEDGLASIKLYNSENKLIKKYFKNNKTGKPDSLSVTYNPDNGNKLSEIAYKNGKIIRKGKYLNNKKNGEWIIYWINGKKETHNTYQNGNLLSSKTIIYEKQVKNNLEKNDLIFSYTSYTPQKKYNFILVRIDSVKGKSKEIIRNKILLSLKNNHLKHIKNTNKIQDEELFSIIYFSNLKTKLKSKTSNKKKYIYLISLDIIYKDLITNTIKKHKIVTTPADKGKSLNNYYTKDKKEAFFTTVKKFEKKLSNYLSNFFPLTGIARKKNGNSSEIWNVYINIGQQQGVLPNDTFVVFDQGQLKAEIKIIEINPNFSIGKVLNGKKWLNNYLKLNKTIKIKRKNYLNNE
jgi:antitoxin component YwqK of YwqJK toxin-antitoxin module